MIPQPPRSTPFPYPTLFRSQSHWVPGSIRKQRGWPRNDEKGKIDREWVIHLAYRPIKYINGNRKIHTMSTRCQYNPASTSGVVYSLRIFRRHTSTPIVAITHTPTSTCRLWYSVIA